MWDTAIESGSDREKTTPETMSLGQVRPPNGSLPERAAGGVGFRRCFGAGCRARSAEVAAGGGELGMLDAAAGVGVFGSLGGCRPPAL